MPTGAIILTLPTHHYCKGIGKAIEILNQSCIKNGLILQYQFWQNLEKQENSIKIAINTYVFAPILAVLMVVKSDFLRLLIVQLFI